MVRKRKKIKIILASASPRRKLLLSGLLNNFGLKFVVKPANIAEHIPEKIADYGKFAANLAYEKAVSVAKKSDGRGTYRTSYPQVGEKSGIHFIYPGICNGNAKPGPGGEYGIIGIGPLCCSFQYQQRPCKKAKKSFHPGTITSKLAFSKHNCGY